MQTPASIALGFRLRSKPRRGEPQRSASAAVEDAVAAGADEAGKDDQDDPKDDLALEKLHNPDDHEHGRDDPEEGCVHVRTLLSS